MDIIDNWKVEHIPCNNGSTGVNPCLVNAELKLAIKLPFDTLRTFGYAAAGCEAGMVNIDTQGTKEEQVSAVLKIVSEELIRSKKEITYWDTRKYLKNYKGKRRFSKFIQPPKTTITAINKTLDLLDVDFQELNEVAIERFKEDAYFKC